MQVLLAKRKCDGTFYAVKVLHKKTILKKKEVCLLSLFAEVGSCHCVSYPGNAGPLRLAFTETARMLNMDFSVPRERREELGLIWSDSRLVPLPVLEMTLLGSHLPALLKTAESPYSRLDSTRPLPETLTPCLLFDSKTTSWQNAMFS